MKLKSLLVAALLGLAAAFSAHATTTYTNGDLFLFVGNVNQANSYVVDLGQQFNWNSSFTIPIAALTTDLNTMIGAGWQSDTNVYFAVVGGTTGSSNLNQHLVLTNPSSSPFNYTHSSEINLANGINTIVGGWSNNDSATSGLSGGNSQALEEVNSSQNSFSFVMGNGFNTFTSANAERGPVTSALFLDNMIAGATNSTPGLTLGSFSVDSANNSLDFTTAAVPKPSSIAAVIMGAAALFAFRRRRA